MLLVERQDPVIENIHTGLRQFGSVKVTKGEGAIGVYHGLEINPANALEGSNKKGILAQDVSRIGTLYIPFPETRIGFFQKLYLFLGENDVLAVFFLLKAKEPFLTGLHVFLDPDIADRAGAGCDSF